MATVYPVDSHYDKCKGGGRTYIYTLILHRKIEVLLINSRRKGRDVQFHKNMLTCNHTFWWHLNHYPPLGGLMRVLQHRKRLSRTGPNCAVMSNLFYKLIHRYRYTFSSDVLVTTTTAIQSLIYSQLGGCEQQDRMTCRTEPDCTVIVQFNKHMHTVHRYTCVPQNRAQLRARRLGSTKLSMSGSRQHIHVCTFLCAGVNMTITLTYMVGIVYHSPRLYVMP